MRLHSLFISFSLVFFSAFLSYAQQQDTLPASQLLQLSKDFGKGEEWDSALVYAQRSVREWEQAPKTEEDTLLWKRYFDAKNQTGISLINLEKEQEALELLQEVIEQLENQFTGLIQTKGDTYHFLGQSYQNLRELPRAREYYEKAISYRKLGPLGTENDLATTYNNLGNTLVSLRDYPKALAYFEQSLEIKLSILPETHPEIGITYNNLGHIYLRQADFPKARTYYEKSLAIKRLHHPKDHPTVAFGLLGLGNVEARSGNFKKALQLYLQALPIFRKTEHSQLNFCLNNIGNIYTELDLPDRALEFYGEALAIRRKKFPPGHPILGLSLHSLGYGNFLLGNFEKALEYYLPAREILQSAGHPFLPGVVGNIGLAYKYLGDYPAALASQEESLELILQGGASTIGYLGACYSYLGEIHSLMGNDQKALEYFQLALQQNVPGFTSSDPLVNPFLLKPRPITRNFSGP